MPSSTTLPRLTLVLGGARSGKSTYAENLLRACGTPPIVIVTAEALDAEMTDRIAHHRAARPATWTTIGAPRALPDTIKEHQHAKRPILVDCLTLWLSNVLLDGTDLDSASHELIAALALAPGPIVLVSNEVGLGIVPDNALARRFRDAQGRLNQRIAASADRVKLLTAGLPLTLK